MNPLLQLNRQLQHLFIALLLACFAIAQSARAVTREPDGGDPNGNTAEGENAVLDLSTDTESGAMGQSTPKRIGDNIWVIPINFTKPLQCAGGDVIVNAKLVVTFRNVPELGVVTRDLKLQDFRGTATSGGRKLQANPKDPKDLKFLPYFKVNTQNGKGEGKFGIEFKVTGPGLPGGSPLRFRVIYNSNHYKFKDEKVTHLIPDDTPTVRCINSSN
jgi:hypothetical protein